MLTYILLTDRCNLACTHCIRGSRAAIDISEEDFRRVYDEVRRVFPDSGFVITGGEPTIHPEFARMLEYALDSSPSCVILNSNGTTEFCKHIADFADYKNLHVQFSIDGAPSEHDRIRGVGAFERMRCSILALKDAGMKLWVSTVVTEGNIGTIEDLRDVLVQIGIEKWHVNPVLPFGCSSGQKPMDVERWNAFVDHLIATTPMRLGIKKLYDFSILEKMDDAQIASLARTVDQCATSNCGCGKRKLYVYPDLTVCGCTCVRDLPFGNLRGASLREVLESENAKRIREYALQPESPCRHCRYVRICNGGCVGMSYHQFGCLGYGDVRCPVFRGLKG